MSKLDELKQSITQALDRLKEQPWYQQIKSKWDDLDSSQKLYIQLGGGITTLLIVIVMLVSQIVHVKFLKGEIQDTIELRAFIQNAIEEKQRLDVLAGNNSTGLDETATPNWEEFVKSKVLSQGIDGSQIQTTPPTEGKKTNTTAEKLLNLNLTHINLRQLVKVAFTLETSEQPIKLRQFEIKAKDPEGYIDATIALSGFEIMKE